MPELPAITSSPAQVPADIGIADRLFSELRALTGGPSGITRRSYGEGEQTAHGILRREGERLNLRVETDAACNLYLTLPGERSDGRIIIGSHMDSVPSGGNYDGAAGVLCGLSVVAGMSNAGVRPPRDISVMAIRAEESTWFAASYIGSRAAFGLLRPDELDGIRRAGDGVTLAEAIAAAGGNVDRLRAGEAHLDRAGIHMFLEPHIEQGPCLVMEGCPLGIVSGIRGSFRHRSATCLGSYAHSGATPRSARQDAVRATAALVAAMEGIWDAAERRGDDVAVTFGKFGTDPAEHAFSKVAGRVDFSLDVRSRSACTLERVASELEEAVERLTEQHSVRFDLGPRTGTAPAEMDSAVVAALTASCMAEGVHAPTMPCGAGHDSVVFAGMGIPTGMLFIRNEHGSHNRCEAMDLDDFAAAARVLTRVCMAPPA